MSFRRTRKSGSCRNCCSRDDERNRGRDRIGGRKEENGDSSRKGKGGEPSRRGRCGEPIERSERQHEYECLQEMVGAAIEDEVLPLQEPEDDGDDGQEGELHLPWGRLRK